MTSRRKVLVVGGGGREHALSLALLASESVAEVLVQPGNAGTARAPDALAHKTLRNVSGDPLSIAKEGAVDLVVVGPEAPLCAGLIDQLNDAGIVAFGPSRKAAELEGSKAMMKAFAERHGIRTARSVVVRDAAEAEQAIASFEVAPVVKADGLCAGKGVVVAATHDEARKAAKRMLSGEAFGSAGSVVVIEERLEGAEASMHAICDGERVLVLPSAQDHKRIGEGDSGPNTGGMGTYAPAPLVTPALAERIRKEILERAVQGMAADGTPFRGTLFAGLMISASGEPCLLEFNVRFGDPETQVLMNLLQGDLAEALSAAARGELSPHAVRTVDRHAVCVVLAAGGYPDAPLKGDVVDGLEAAAKREGVAVYHAGTRLDGDRVLTSGGRVLGVTGVGRTLQEAHERAYGAAELITFEGRQMRRDIARRALGA